VEPFKLKQAMRAMLEWRVAAFAILAKHTDCHPDLRRGDSQLWLQHRSPPSGDFLFGIFVRRPEWGGVRPVWYRGVNACFAL